MTRPQMSLAAIEARSEAFGKRAPSPVVERAVSDQMHRDIRFLLGEVERLRAAP